VLITPYSLLLNQIDHMHAAHTGMVLGNTA